MSIFHWPRRGGSGAASPPAATVLAISDNADGTGGVATVTGSSAGATNRVYSQAVNGEIGTGTWVLRATISENGSAAVAPGNGYYWWRCESTTSGGTSQSNLVYQNLTSGVASVHYRCQQAVQARIQGLSLSGVNSASVLVRKLPWALDVGSGHTYSFPAVFVSPPGNERLNPTEGTTVADEHGYPVLVAIAAADNQQLVTNHATYLKWREQITRAFHQQRLVGVAESKITFVEPGTVIDPAMFSKQFFHSLLTIRCVCKLTRGLT